MWVTDSAIETKKQKILTAGLKRLGYSHLGKDSRTTGSVGDLERAATDLVQPLMRVIRI
jgi:hypothetical protein